MLQPDYSDCVSNTAKVTGFEISHRNAITLTHILLPLCHIFTGTHKGCGGFVRKAILLKAEKPPSVFA